MRAACSRPGAPADILLLDWDDARRGPPASRSRSARSAVRALDRAPHQGADRRRQDGRCATAACPASICRRMNEDLLARFRHGIAQNGTLAAALPAAGARRARSFRNAVLLTCPIAKVHRISASAPNDVSGIESRDRGRPHRSGRHRGDPRQDRGQRQRQRFHPRLCDARAHAACWRSISAPRAKDICLVMSGGTEGAMAPHWTVFERAEGSGKGPALAIGRAHTPALRPEQLGRLAAGGSAWPTA